jgi:hypothetical protein
MLGLKLKAGVVRKARHTLLPTSSATGWALALSMATLSGRFETFPVELVRPFCRPPDECRSRNGTKIDSSRVA